MRTMYDAINTSSSSIPVSAELVAGYDTGYIWSAADWARFPHARHVHICQRNQMVGQVLDVESGAATVGYVVGWIRNRRAAGIDPTVYCSSSTWPQVRAAVAAAGITPPHYWIAQYDGVASIPTSWLDLGCVAKQYRSLAAYDLSVVVDYWPGIDPAPVTNSVEDEMSVSVQDLPVPKDHELVVNLEDPATSAARAQAVWVTVGVDAFYAKDLPTSGEVVFRIAYWVTGKGWTINSDLAVPVAGDPVVLSLPAHCTKLAICPPYPGDADATVHVVTRFA